TLRDPDRSSTLVHHDPAPTLFPYTTLFRSNAGAFVFTVTKTGSTALPSSVAFQTVDGTATVADGDYVANNGTLNFAPTQTTMSITVTVNGDNKFENDEMFTVRSEERRGGKESKSDGTGSNVNDEPAANFAINDVSQNERNSGPTSYISTVSKPRSSVFHSTAALQTVDVTATVADGDYVANNGTLNFAPTQTTMSITVTVNGDNKFENDEMFTV